MVQQRRRQRAHTWQPVYAESSKAAKYKTRAGLLTAASEAVKGLGTDPDKGKEPDRYKDVVSGMLGAFRTDKDFIKNKRTNDPRMWVKFRNHAYKNEDEAYEFVKAFKGADWDVDKATFVKALRWHKRKGVDPDFKGLQKETAKSMAQRDQLPLTTKDKDGKEVPYTRAMIMKEITGTEENRTGWTEADWASIEEAREKRETERLAVEFTNPSNGSLDMRTARAVLARRVKEGAYTKAFAKRAQVKMWRTKYGLDRQRMAMESARQVMKERGERMADAVTERRLMESVGSVTSGRASYTTLEAPPFKSAGRRHKWDKGTDRLKQAMRNMVFNFSPKVGSGTRSRRRTGDYLPPMDVLYGDRFVAEIAREALARAAAEGKGDLLSMPSAAARGIVRGWTGLSNDEGNEIRGILKVAGQVGMTPEAFARQAVWPEKRKLSPSILENLRRSARGLKADDVKAFRDYFGIEAPKAPVTVDKTGWIDKIRSFFGGVNEKVTDRVKDAKVKERGDDGGTDK